MTGDVKARAARRRETLFKVVRPDSSPWHGDGLVYEPGRTLRRRVHGDPVLCSPTVLHAARTPERAARFGSWPYRLLEVEGTVAVEDGEKVGCRQLTVVAERPVHECWGPNGRQVEAVIRRAGTLTYDEIKQLTAVRDAAWDAARDAVRAAVWAAARAAAWDAAWACVVADLVGQHGLTQQHIDTLRDPWEQVMGPTWEDAA